MTKTTKTKSATKSRTTRSAAKVKLGEELIDYVKCIDPLHQSMNFAAEPLSRDVWEDKYKWHNDQNFDDMCLRVAGAINGCDGKDHVMRAYSAMRAGLWIPAGRVLAGAGTAKVVTLINCFVNAEMQDDLADIVKCQGYTALTMQQGGGMGTDFSPLRPEDAFLRRTHSKASGPLPFMDGWNAWSKTIRSAGDRRGAMMGTLCDTHPDLPKFITAKHKKGRLAEFNVSVLVSEGLMEAVREDEEWLLYFHIHPFKKRPSELEDRDFVDDDGTKQYVYSVWRARQLWELITRNTYEWSEPGVIFIDRINHLNNLKHVEQIRCTNPCGEQPLPPHGACDLGHANIARCVRKPFTKDAHVDWALFNSVVRLGQRFLDNVLDVTLYPLEEQYQESMFKRRTGLGITGLADAMMQLRLRYGSPASVEFAERVAYEMCMASYEENIALAKEKGPCPAMTKEMIKRHNVLENGCFISQRLPTHLKEQIAEHGLRNGVALTIAPTGTVSIVFGNLDGSGCECAFAHTYNRKVRVPGHTEDEYKEYKNVHGYTHRLYEAYRGEDLGDIELPSYFVTAGELGVEDHIAVQAALQRWVDASISKTVNCPVDMPFGEFQKVYDLAYSLGCKGCTTYRPSDVRGSILSTDSTTPNGTGGSNGEGGGGDEDGALKPRRKKRAPILHGSTYQIKWPSRASALYLTLNHDADGYLVEMLITSKDSSNFEWMTALTLMVTAIFKKGGNIAFVADELQQIRSFNDIAWFGERCFQSLPAYIGYLLEQHLQRGVPISDVLEMRVATAEEQKQILGHMETCPQCHAPSLTHMEGCKKCISCSYSSCG